ncbi:ATP-binding protein [Candidatus Parcubacteria bacterium]|nr:MAG: ATP-binding protein [Candidatus Parcubacteria bacterium]
MLIEFSVGNYRSFNEIQTLDMRTAPLRERIPEGEQHTFQAGKYKLLRCSAVYGANASGKSNLVRALLFMRQFVLTSATKLQIGDATGVERFKLDTAARTRPAYFQIVFLLNGITYRYGFELDEERVRAEWLYRTRQRESRLFVREEQEFDVSGTLKVRKGVPEMTRPNALFLSVLAQFNNAEAASILGWFRKKLHGISGLNDKLYGGYTIRRIENDAVFRKRVRTLLRLADIGINDIGVESIPLSQVDMPSEMRDILQNLVEVANKEVEKHPQEHLLTAPQDLFQTTPKDTFFKSVTTRHSVFDGKSTQPIEEDETFNLEEHESDGTQKFFYLLGPWLDSLDEGNVLFVDEMDARLHPLLTRELVRMFLSPQSNPHNAQLIFTTHDAGLLGERILRRDEVWFTEKNRFGATELYSLADMRERNDASFYKNYLLGLYGAVPHLGGLRPFVEQEMQDAQNAETERAQETTR